jgi:hypothetical protein
MQEASAALSVADERSSAMGHEASVSTAQGWGSIATTPLRTALVSVYPVPGTLCRDATLDRDIPVLNPWRQMTIMAKHLPLLSSIRRLESPGQ